MRNRCFPVTTLLTVLALASCSTAPETTTTTAPTAAMAPTSAHTSMPTTAQPSEGIECAMCFTIIEYMRSGPRHQTRERTVVQCERCCETLTFTEDGNGQLFVATKAHPTPMPCDVCAPAPIR